MLARCGTWTLEISPRTIYAFIFTGVSYGVHTLVFVPEVYGRDIRDIEDGHCGVTAW